VRQPTDYIEKLLVATYQNHACNVRHKLKECSMIKNYMTMGALTKSKKPDDDLAGNAAVPFLREEVSRPKIPKFGM
jgi:hypothetical protein